MKNLIIGLVILFSLSISQGCKPSAKVVEQSPDEMYRPALHFTPAAHWMNDPNGMVYSKGVYHLFFQYHPNSSVWGPMHWGHATSTDLVNWKELPIALYPDSIGTIFSGSAVFDKDNTSGFGKDGKAPLVAIYTQHDMDGEKGGRNNYQTQSIAYSNDEGNTWTKYEGNPVIKNPGITDFRDPKVMWYEPQKKWIMTLATKDRITFYSSPDLKSWEKQSEFGASLGAHGGVWECPDLFSMDYNGTKVWVLIVNINPGGPNGGSATQYFLGDFDGKDFTTTQTNTKWLDYGPDEYAGITWSNTGDRKLFLGWMSNWLYANVVPTETWRSAMTIARDLRLEMVGQDLRIASKPAPELEKIEGKKKEFKDLKATVEGTMIFDNEEVQFPLRMNLNTDDLKDFSIILSNDAGEELVIGYNNIKNQYFIDRTKSGKVDFQKDFASTSTAPRFAAGANMDMTLVIDKTSVELFADNGLSVMTAIFFPNTPYSQGRVSSPGNMVFKELEWIELKK